ncbi:hypothetical protein T492DRAFT_30162 [Pavlovales sp. CCMP2436]|nr:hypothetical protein T492DRAFT_30162 [Pavlovales sp. CCMP2436]
MRAKCPPAPGLELPPEVLRRDRSLAHYEPLEWANRTLLPQSSKHNVRRHAGGAQGVRPRHGDGEADVRERGGRARQAEAALARDARGAALHRRERVRRSVRVGADSTLRRWQPALLACPGACRAARLAASRRQRAKHERRNRCAARVCAGSGRVAALAAKPRGQGGGDRARARSAAARAGTRVRALQGRVPRRCQARERAR